MESQGDDLTLTILADQGWFCGKGERGCRGLSNRPGYRDGAVQSRTAAHLATRSSNEIVREHSTKRLRLNTSRNLGAAAGEQDQTPRERISIVVVLIWVPTVPRATR